MLNIVCYSGISSCVDSVRCSDQARGGTMLRFDRGQTSTFVAVIGLVLISVAIAPADQKKDLSERYKKGKYLVVMRDGLPLAICSEKSDLGPDLQVKITESGVDTKQGFLRSFGDAGIYCPATPEPTQKGEVLKSGGAGVRGKWLFIRVESLSPHAVTRGVGAFEHESHEYPAATLVFSVETGNDQGVPLTDQWVEPFDTQEEAARFGNTASGAFVKEVKLGMTPAEVEAALGVPETKADLGGKILYKYKNMTVEFHDGKVSDVR
jgi:hypothetical protein